MSGRLPRCAPFAASLLALAGCGREKPERDVVISEILHTPEPGSPCGEFVELHNRSGRTVDLDGWSFAAGIRFRFPGGAALAAGERLVVASAGCGPGVLSLGPFGGRLDGGGEALRLADAAGRTVDAVAYDDERGWPRAAGGRSLERVHADAPSSVAGSWAEGPPGGTPGRENAAAVPEAPAIVHDVRQSPAAPTPGEEIVFEARVSGAAGGPVSLRYRPEGSGGDGVVAMSAVPGAQGGGAAGGLYRCGLPAPGRSAVVEFRIEAAGADGGIAGSFPRGSGWALFAVAAPPGSAPSPLLRVVARAADLRAFAARPLFSDEPLPGSVVEEDRIHYGAAVRLRGSTTRGASEKDYEIDFSSCESWEGERRVPVHCFEAGREYVGRLAFEAAGLPSVLGRPISLALGDAIAPRCLRGERFSRRFLERRFGDPRGDVLRGVSQPLSTDPSADPGESLRAFRERSAADPVARGGAAPMADGEFDYRGDDPRLYRSSYLPVVGGGPEALAKIVRISEAFGRAPDDGLVRRLSGLIDVDQWVRYFAARQALGDGEHGLHSREGQDYYVYFGPADGLARLLPWDLDQVLATPHVPLHGHLVRAVMRLLRRDGIAPAYAAEVARLLEGPLSVGRMRGILGRAAPLLRPGEGERMLEAFAGISRANLGRIPRALSVEAGRRIARSAPLGDDVWPLACVGWDDPALPLPLCAARGGAPADGGPLEVRLAQRFAVPDPEAVTSARISVRPPATTGKAVSAARAAGGELPVCRVAVSVNGEPVIAADVSGLGIAGDGKIAEAGLRRGLVAADNSAEMSIACPGTLMRRFSGQMADRGKAPTVGLDLEWTAPKGGVVLAGRADATRTRRVRVDGRDAGYVPWRAEWLLVRATERPVDCALVEALDGSGAAFETLRVGLVAAGAPGAAGGRRCPGGAAADVWVEY